MARRTKLTGLAEIEARRDALKKELEQLDARSREVEALARDAGRPTFLAAIERVKIPALSKHEARTIATAIGRHGGRIAEHLATLVSTPARTD